MSKKKKIALVAGATGVVGRILQKYLVSQDDWEIIALSRRTPDVASEYRHISVDLLDLDDYRAKLEAGLGVTHIFSPPISKRKPGLRRCRQMSICRETCWIRSNLSRRTCATSI